MNDHENYDEEMDEDDEQFVNDIGSHFDEKVD